MGAKSQRPALALVLLLGCQSAFAQTNLAFWVAPGGSDTNAGTPAAPFATLEQARDAVRSARSGQPSNALAMIWVGDGTFYRTRTFQLSAADANLTILAEPTASPRLCGGARLDPAWFAPVPTNSPVWPRLDTSAQGFVLQVDLAAHGVTNLGVLRPRGMGGLSASDPGPFPAELFCRGQPLELARWPNTGSFANLASTSTTNSFTYTGTRPNRWLNAPDPWYHGYWYYLWADFTLPGTGLNTNTSTITLAQAPRSYGIRAGQPWFAFNLLEEIDTPGEYYLDRSQQMLYLWPPANFATADLFVSQLDSPLITVQGATNIVMDGLELTGGRGDLLTIGSACFHVEFRHGRLIGAGRRGAVLDGVSNQVTACEIAYPGDYGVVLSGGNRLTLSPGNNTVRDCRLHHFSRLSFTYTPAAQVNGAGQRVVHNQIFSAPHAGILFSGNEHVIAFNDISAVCQWTSDGGAIYSGRDWGYRGNRIHCNFIHDVTSGFAGLGVHAVYLDDCVSGIEVSSNVVYRVQNYALFNGGGRDNLFQNNVVARGGTFHYGDARGTSAIVTNTGSSWNLLEKIVAMNYQQPTWSNAYPALAVIPNNYSLLGPYKTPGGTVFSRNIGWSNTTAFSQSGAAFGYYAQWTNNITNSNPLFVDEANLDLTLQSNSPAFTIPGFGAIPFLAIGVGLPLITNAQAGPAPTGFAAAQAWIDPRLDSNCVVQLCYGAVDCGRTTNGWDHVAVTNLALRGTVSFQVPAGANQSYVGRFRAVNQEGESWSTTAFVFPTILTWDNGSGNGQWDTTSTNWSGAALWNNGTPDSAIFGPAGAGTVTLATPITASSLSFNSPGYTLTGSTLTLAGPSPSITNNADATIASVLAGTTGFTKAGSNTLTLTSPGTCSGGVTIAAGALTLSSGSNLLLNSSGIAFSGSGALNLRGVSQTLSSLTVATGNTATLAGSGTLALGANAFLLGNEAASGNTTLDLHGLGTFSFTGPANAFQVTAGLHSAASYASTLILATNTQLTAASFIVGGVGSANIASTSSNVVSMGQATLIHTDTFKVGYGRNQGTLTFQGGLTNPTLTLRGTDGTSRAGLLYVGEINSGGQSFTRVSTLDTTAGTLDASVATMIVAYNDRGNGDDTPNNSYFLMGGGTLDATAITLGKDMSGSTGGYACTGTLTVNGGTVKVGTLTLGDRTGGLTVSGIFNLNSGALLKAQAITAGAGAATRAFNWNDGTISTLDASTDLIFGSGLNVTLAAAGAPTFNIGAGRTATAASVLSGAGGLTKAGAGTLVLAATNTYAGPTGISAGTLLVNGQVGSNAVTVASGAILGGAGLIRGPVTLQAGGWLAPSALGPRPSTLTLSNSVSFQGGAFAVMALNKSFSPANDLLLASSIAFDGNLVVSNLGPALLVGDRFVLFNTQARSGAFTNFVLPALAPGLAWTNTLALDGAIAVYATPPTAPTNLAFAVVAGGSQLHLLWPSNYTGWLLQSNAASVANTSSWFTVPGSDITNEMLMLINHAKTNVFYRMLQP